LVILIAAGAAAMIPLKTWWDESRVIARVNGEAVTRGALQRMLSDGLMVRQFEQELGGKKASGQDMQHMALRELIVRRLFLQEAARRRFLVTDQDLDRAVADWRVRFKDPKAFQEWLRARGLDEKTLREDVRVEILMNRVRAALVEGVRATEEEIRAYHESHKDNLAPPEELRLRIIAVKDKNAAEEIIADLKKGADFGQMAQRRSTGFQAHRGGDLGWVDPRFLPPPLGDVVRSLNVGATSQLLQGKEGFYVVRLEGRRPGRPLSLTEVRPEIERRLLGAKQRQAIQQWLEGQQKNARIEAFL
jgi:parvulin-like peptidyl-prolyl isomerase